MRSQLHVDARLNTIGNHMGLTERIGPLQPGDRGSVPCNAGIDLAGPPVIADITIAATFKTPWWFLKPRSRFFRFRTERTATGHCAGWSSLTVSLTERVPAERVELRSTAQARRLCHLNLTRGAGAESQTQIQRSAETTPTLSAAARLAPPEPEADNPAPANPDNPRPAAASACKSKSHPRMRP